MNRVIILLAALTASANCASVSAPLASWFWNTDMITNSGYVSDILAFAETVGLTHIYAQIDSSISNADWESFIGKFTASGIIVDALLGDPSWVLQAGDLETELQWIEQYQNSASASSKFTGIHMDVEPWDYSNFTSDEAEYIGGWQNVVTEISTFGQTLGMPVAADLPFWCYLINSTTAGETMDIWILDRLDSANFMTYRNTSAGIESLASSPLQAGEMTGKQVWLGAETGEVADEPETSFYGQTFEATQSALAAVAEFGSSNMYFAGIAIDDLTSWMAMPGSGY